jgi:RNA polymerase sigma factor, sigma-70 family
MTKKFNYLCHRENTKTVRLSSDIYVTKHLADVNTSFSETENVTLIEELRSGSVDAAERLFSKYQKRLYSYILSSVKDDSIARDLLQEAMLKAFVSIKRGQYHEDGRFEPWLVRIARNVLMDHYRDRKRFHQVHSDREVSMLPDTFASSITPDNELMVSQQRTQVRELIQELPETQKEVVILRHFLGLTFQEIATHTGVSINTALGRMRYALINLRKIASEQQLLDFTRG